MVRVGFLEDLNGSVAHVTRGGGLPQLLRYSCLGCVPGTFLPPPLPSPKSEWRQQTLRRHRLRPASALCYHILCPVTTGELSGFPLSRPPQKCVAFIHSSITCIAVNPSMPSIGVLYGLLILCIPSVHRTVKKCMFFPWHNSPQWARASLSKIPNHPQTHYSR
jgi:hypothetical protein